MNISRRLSMALIAVTATAVSVGTGVGGTRAKADLSSVAQLDPPGLYGLPDSTLLAEGYLIYQPTAIVSLPGGGVKYVYDVAGHQAEFPVTPPGFDPFSASPDVLAAYDLPSRPSGGAALAGWTQLMTNWAAVVPTARLVLPTSQAPAIWSELGTSAPVPGSGTPHRTIPDPTHSGYQNFNPGVTFTDTGLSWTEPTYSGCNQNNYVDILWPGIQGTTPTGAAVVTQDGTLSDHTSSTSYVDHQVWYATNPPQNATYHGPNGTPGPMTIPAGHGVDAVVHHGVNATTSNYIVKDLTTGVAWIASDTSVVAAPDDAEYDVEVQPNQDLANFGPLSFSYAYWVTSSGSSGFVGESASSTGQIVANNITDASGNTEDTTGGTYDSNGNTQSAFNMTWNACN